jgi:hypothetical protein
MFIARVVPDVRTPLEVQYGSPCSLSRYIALLKECMIITI